MKIIAIAASLVFLAGCGSSNAYNIDRENKDPRVGPVVVLESNARAYEIVKVCDGSTLVYARNDAIDVIANSPECS